MTQLDAKVYNEIYYRGFLRTKNMQFFMSLDNSNLARAMDMHTDFMVQRGYTHKIAYANQLLVPLWIEREAIQEHVKWSKDRRTWRVYPPVNSLYEAVRFVARKFKLNLHEAILLQMSISRTGGVGPSITSWNDTAIGMKRIIEVYKGFD